MSDTEQSDNRQHKTVRLFEGELKMEVAGLLLCSECENQLKVEVYSEEFGFFKVYPCTHCASQQVVGDGK